MTDKQAVVLKGLLELTEEERNEVIREALGYKTKTFSEKFRLDETLNKSRRIMGPLGSSTCPCCGK